ncbi:MAG: hypothetical protein J0M35_13000 [Candidatus Obscuribacter phosphatis]|uniref:Uncharacterized protein n=1 Tax=Candidatus Obscuribacter phosphatis TaxID=1906157 RepID=A0A8J7PJ05_9BACT|nr:hypothetical protein [Candidatus Obscuribacter phosphatis]
MANSDETQGKASGEIEKPSARPDASAKQEEGGKHWLDYARDEGFEFGPANNPDSPKLIISGQELLAHTCSRILLGLLLFWSFLAGAWVAGTALHDPDTCWLMALGRYIFESQSIPSTDPFSYTFAELGRVGSAAVGALSGVELGHGSGALPGRNFVLYQWLSEVLFYVVTAYGGLLAVLMLTACCIVTAYLSLPLSVAVKRESNFLLAIVATLLGMLSASFHTLVRPEIFSFVFLSIYLQLIHHSRADYLTGGKKLFPIVLVAAPLMVLWANMHTGFTTAFSLVTACLLGAVGGAIFFKAENRNLVVLFTIALFGMAAASLINPYGIGLWLYIPELFFSRMNQFIVELSPLDPTKVIYWPYLALVVLYVVTFIRTIIWYRRDTGTNSPELRRRLLTEILISFLIGSIGIFNSFKTSRLIVFVALMLVAEVSALSGLRRLLAVKEEEPKPQIERNDKGEAIIKSQNHLKGFWWNFDHHTLDIWKAGGAGELAIVCFCALAGVSLIASRVVKPELPASSAAFQVPSQKAMTLATADERLRGRVFNDPQIGDVLIYRSPGKPKVFIDTRFDMYGDEHVLNYRAINECQNGFQQKLAALKVDWVILQPKAPLAKFIRQEAQAAKGWQILFEDETAFIAARKS